MDKLQPCPCCGGELVLINRKGQGHDVLHKNEYPDCQYSMYLPTNNRDMAIKEANRRFTGNYDSRRTPQYPNGKPICTGDRLYWAKRAVWLTPSGRKCHREVEIIETFFNRNNVWDCRILPSEVKNG